MILDENKIFHIGKMIFFIVEELMSSSQVLIVMDDFITKLQHC